MYKLLFTFQKEVTRLAEDEMRRFGATPVRMVSDEVCLAETEANLFADSGQSFVQPVRYASASRGVIAANPPIFVRHVCPADYIMGWDESADDIYGKTLSLIHSANLEAHPKSGRRKTIGIQARSVADVSAKPKGAALDAIHKAVDDSGVMRASGAPDIALSVAFAQDEIIMGISPALMNLSSFAGGSRRFARTEDMVSRSEFKLLEAFETFRTVDSMDVFLHFKAEVHGRALDLGAAPGGWSRILANMGYNITAVDPADLDARLADNERITHVKATAQEYADSIRGNAVKFDLLANDMKMDSSLSARIVAQFREYIKPDGLVILTLKLHMGKFMRQINNARMILEPRFDIIGIRQLFHNRSEVTLYAKPKP